MLSPLVWSRGLPRRMKVFAIDSFSRKRHNMYIYIYTYLHNLRRKIARLNLSLPSVFFLILFYFCLRSPQICMRICAPRWTCTQHHPKHPSGANTPYSRSIRCMDKPQPRTLDLGTLEQLRHLNYTICSIYNVPRLRCSPRWMKSWNESSK